MKNGYERDKRERRATTPSTKTFRSEDAASDLNLASAVAASDFILVSSVAASNFLLSS